MKGRIRNENSSRGKERTVARSEHWSPSSSSSSLGSSSRYSLLPFPSLCEFSCYKGKIITLSLCKACVRNSRMHAQWPAGSLVWTSDRAGLLGLAHPIQAELDPAQNKKNRKVSLKKIISKNLWFSHIYIINFAQYWFVFYTVKIQIRY
jgi:hypothetical protein